MPAILTIHTPEDLIEASASGAEARGERDQLSELLSQDERARQVFDAAKKVSDRVRQIERDRPGSRQD